MFIGFIWIKCYHISILWNPKTGVAYRNLKNHVWHKCVFNGHPDNEDRTLWEAVIDFKEIDEIEETGCMVS